jgi:hypothetical protein
MRENFKKYRLLLFIIISVAISVMVYEELRKITGLEADNFVYKFTSLALIVVLLLILSSFEITQRQSIAYNVAIIGLPKSGKTTMITTLFASIMYNRVNLKKYYVSLKGNSTIERVNENLGKLEKGIPIGSTNDQTLFAFKVDVVSKRKFFPKEYKVEFGDFPGEASTELVLNENNVWIHNSEFFTWVKKADSFIFTIDLGQFILHRGGYVAEVSKSIRSAWQLILSNNEYIKDIAPIALVFTKADLFKYYSDEQMSEKEILDVAFSDNKLPFVENDIVKGELERFKRDVIHDFDNLIRFFSLTSKNTKVVFISSFIEYEKYKLGFEELANHVLPN